MFKPLYDFLGKVVVEIVNPFILLLIAVAGLVFVWGVFKFIRAEGAGESGDRAESQKMILWSIVGFAIMFGAYGIINIALGTFDLPPIQKGFLQNGLNK